MTRTSELADWRERAAAEAAAVAALPSFWLANRLDIEKEAAAALVRSSRIRSKLAEALTRRGQLAPLSSLPLPLVEALTGQGAAYERVCLKIGLAQALSAWPVLERKDLQGLLAVYETPAVAFAVSWLGRPLAEGEVIRSEDRSAVLAAGKSLLQVWFGENDSKLGGWPTPVGQTGYRFNVVFGQRLQDAVSCALSGPDAPPNGAVA